MADIILGRNRVLLGLGGLPQRQNSGIYELSVLFHAIGIINEQRFLLNKVTRGQARCEYYIMSESKFLLESSHSEPEEQAIVF